VRNPFVNPVSQLDRVKYAQVCPHCFAQVFTVWGADQRMAGRCPECKRRIYLYRGVLHSQRDAIVLAVVFGSVALSLLVWFIYAWCF
jgi:hypothetical protein